jgi:putative endonuclease
LKSIEHKKTYVGMTNDIERRIQEHNWGKTIYTRKYMPWKLAYKEELTDRKEARAKEKYFKSAAGRKRIKLLLDNLRPRSSAG